SFLGATAGTPDAAGPRLVMDLGGGSTELVLGESTADAGYSMNIGCGRLFGRHLGSDPPTAEQIAALRGGVDDAFTEAGQHVDGSAGRTLVGVAGPTTPVAAAALDLDRSARAAIHGTRLTRTQVLDTADRLAAMTSDERRALPYMHPGRADV